MYKSNTLKLILFSVAIFLVPNLFWGKYSLYQVGGDDSLLYYLFPFEMVKHYLFNLVSDNVLSGLGTYGPQFYQAPFYLLIYAMKTVTPFFNTQLFFFGLNLSLGFLFFYLLLSIWIRNVEWYEFWLKVSVSLFYIFSIFSFYTLMNSKFFPMYLVAIFPLALYLFLKGVYENKPVYIVVDALVLSLFSILLLAVPWLAALLLSVLPLLIFIFLQHKKRFIKFSVLLVVLTLLLNFYWIFHILYSSYSSRVESQETIRSFNTIEFRKANEFLIRSVSSHNELIYPLFNLFHKQIQIDYSWKSFEIYKGWHLKLLPFNLIFLIIVLIAALLSRRVSGNLRRFYYGSFLMWLVTLFLFTVNIGTWGIDVFLWLTNHVPWFVMFRNMFDKFGLAMAFSYACLVGISLKICLDFFRRDTLKILIIGSTIAIIIINAKPFIFGEYAKNPLWTTQNTFTTISDFNQDFYELVEYLKKIDDPSRILWLPINSANYVQIRDESLFNHYYVGVSPLLFLAKKSDLSGIISFAPSVHKDFFDSILGNRYERLGKLFQRMNVKYIILNNDISNDLQRSYLYSYYTPGDFYSAQGDNFKTVILGEKVNDFGGRYSLYRINKAFNNEKIYLSNSLEDIPEDFSNVTYYKLASYAYKISINNLKETSHLVFLDPYYKEWQLIFSQNNVPLASGHHEVVFDYANGWKIDPSYIKSHYPSDYYKKNPDGSIDIALTLFFRPQAYFYPGAMISAGTLIILIGYLCYGLMRRRSKRIH